MTQAFVFFLSLLSFVACNSHQAKHEEATTKTIDTTINQPAPDHFIKGNIIGHIACIHDASMSYALYIPAADDQTKMPVIYFFDPHSNGALPLQHYKALADAFHFILVGSNNSKNGNDWSLTQSILNTLFSDTQSRLLFNHNRIYACGFSGGAKVAGYAALHKSEIKGVIAAGAGLPDGEPARQFSFSFTGMAGNGDMNMTDLVALNNELDKTGTTHRLILFDGKHAWPPADAMQIAFTGLQFDAARTKLIDKNDSLIQNYVKKSGQQIRDDINAHQLIKAQQVCTLSIAMLNGLSADADWFAKKENDIKSNPAYQQQRQAEQQLFSFEQSKKQTYQQQFQQDDIQYWTTTIRDLQTKAKARTDEGAMYERLLAYLSLAFYSISNQLVNSNQNEAAQYFVTLYKMADATNSEAWYFSALLNARNQDAKATENDLLTAAGLGFTDTARMVQQPEFTSLSPQLNFSLIESKMKATE